MKKTLWPTAEEEAAILRMNGLLEVLQESIKHGFYFEIPAEDAKAMATYIKWLERNQRIAGAAPRRAAKVGGSYQAEGTILAEFRADDGSPRYVFRFDSPPGLLHIFSGAQLQFKEEK